MTGVVVLPGLDGTGSLLAGFCTAVEARGVPASVVGYPPDRPLGYDGLEAIVRGRLPNTPFVLLGESFSGPLAIRIAADPPPGLVGLVLSTTFARSPIGHVSTIAPLLRVAPARRPVVLLSWLLLGPWATPRLRAQLRDALACVDPAVLRARAAETLRVDSSGKLGHCGSRAATGRGQRPPAGASCVLAAFCWIATQSHGPAARATSVAADGDWTGRAGGGCVCGGSGGGAARGFGDLLMPAWPGLPPDRRERRLVDRSGHVSRFGDRAGSAESGWMPSGRHLRGRLRLCN